MAYQESAQGAYDSTIRVLLGLLASSLPDLGATSSDSCHHRELRMPGLIQGSLTQEADCLRQRAGIGQALNSTPLLAPLYMRLLASIFFTWFDFVLKDRPEAAFREAMVWSAIKTVASGGDHGMELVLGHDAYLA
ncbi:hypothetical protein VM1G_05793 [Cytospora mali]|uniref:Uncharacterized protein n=1 Tax=Cytospora mali TaxID=578113 RepID=A0A194W2B1_CYTMA|nr:hypothetical protein VM1G_05793 [Valsa mali]